MADQDKSFFKKYWWIILAISLVPFNNSAGGKSNFLGISLQFLGGAFQTTMSSFNGMLPAVERTATSVVGAPVNLVPATNLPAAGDAVPASLSPTTTISVDGGQVLTGKWILSNRGLPADHPNPNVVADLQRRFGGEFRVIPQPNGRNRFFQVTSATQAEASPQ